MICIIILLLLLFVAKGQFLAHPRNQTAKYGYFVDFECRASNCGDTLRFLANDFGLAILDLDSREYGKNVTCSDSQLMGTFWMVVNNKTIQAVNYVSCNVTIVNSTGVYDISSDRAYMEVVYPNYRECEPASEGVPSIVTAYHQTKQTISGARKGLSSAAFSLQILLLFCLLFQ